VNRLSSSLTVALLLAGCNNPSQTQTKTTAGTPGKAAKVEMYVMSQCPYGVKAENAMFPVKKQLGDAMDLDIQFIGRGDVTELSSLHGAPEVKGDLVQICAAQQDKDALLDMILCQNKNPKKVDTNWESCAGSAGLDVEKIRTCAEGDAGKQLLAASFADAKKRGAKGSPTIFVDGERYQGGRKTSDFLRAVCNTFDSDAPKVCADLPVPPQVDAIFLSDARCKKCDIRPLEGKLKGNFAGLKVQYLDYKDTDGKALYDKLHAADPSFVMLPAVLLSQNVKKDTEGYAGIKKYLEPAGDYLTLKLGGAFDPTAEICDNKIDDDGNGQVDCDDAGCDQALLCRESKPQTLDLFVMSHCPYGAKALIAANEVVDHFGDDISLNVHYIGSDRNGTLTSLHGQPEVDDDVRELCAQKYYPENHQFLDYMACFSKDYKKADWKACAAEAKMDTGVIQKCFDGEGKDLLRSSFSQAQALSISSSPTFISNNTRKFNATAAPALQKQFCKDNASVAGCDSMVVADAGNAAPVPAGECK